MAESACDLNGDRVDDSDPGEEADSDSARAGATVLARRVLGVMLPRLEERIAEDETLAVKPAGVHWEDIILKGVQLWSMASA